MAKLNGIEMPFHIDKSAIPSRKYKRTVEQYRAAAKRIHHEEGVIEIDDKAAVSRGAAGEGSEGAYVQAWIWVDASEVDKDEKIYISGIEVEP